MKLKVITIDEMIAEILKIMNEKDTPYVENTHLSRTLQLMIAPGMKFENTPKHQIDDAALRASPKLPSLYYGNFGYPRDVIGNCI